MYKQLIADWQNYIKNAKFIKREYVFPLDLLKLDKIISFVWARRVGKTTIMKQVLQELVELWYISYQNIIRIDANGIDPINFNMDIVLKSYFEIYPNLEPFIVIDEVHELPDRVRQVFVAYNKWYKLFLSGSNAHVLSSEISTKLRWKVYEQRIYSLSWSEYCKFINYTVDFSTQWQWLRNKLFQEYLHYWWFPEVALSVDRDIKIGLLKNYFDVLLYKDLIERYNIDKEFVIKYLIKYLSSTITKEFSIDNFVNQLKSQWVKISKPSIYNYMEYLQNIFFIYPLQQRYKQRWSIKYYLNDIWYSSLWDKDWMGKKFENYVINTYQQQWESIHFDKNKEGEIDLSTDIDDIQLCFHLTAENITRETNSLLSTHKNKKCIFFQKDTHLQLPPWIEYISIRDI